MSTTVSTTVPEPIARVAEAMAGYGGRWALCGGWAVDAWLGRLSRDHGDVDISIFEDEQQLLYEHLDGWQLLGHDGAWEADNHERWWDGQYHLTVPSHIHARPPDQRGAMPKNGIAHIEDGFWLDIQIDRRAGGDWVVSDEPYLTAPLDRCVRETPWGVPASAPEMVLFYKSRDMRLRDRLDFAALHPLLDERQRAWLRDAIDRAGHPWLRWLSA